MIGETLSKNLRLYVHARDFGLELPEQPCATSALLQELVHTRQQLVEVKSKLAEDY